MRYVSIQLPYIPVRTQNRHLLIRQLALLRMVDAAIVIDFRRFSLWSPKGVYVVDSC